MQIRKKYEKESNIFLFMGFFNFLSLFTITQLKKNQFDYNPYPLNLVIYLCASNCIGRRNYDNISIITIYTTHTRVDWNTGMSKSMISNLLNYLDLMVKGFLGFFVLNKLYTPKETSSPNVSDIR